MKIIVCIKAVPDPDMADFIKIDPSTKTLKRNNIPLVLNPMDKYALEAALKLKEENQAQVTVISMGPPGAETIVKECMALGADKGILMSDPAFGGADTFATAYTLASGIKKAGRCDLVLCGMASSDGSTEWVGPQIASFLDFPVVTMVNSIEERRENTWVVNADFENGYTRVKFQLPAVLTVTRDLNHPRILSFSGIIKARKKKVSVWDLEESGIDPGKVGVNGSPTIVSEMNTIENKREITMIEGTREEKAEQVLRILKEFGAL